MALGTYIDSDRYPTFVFTKWEIVPVIDSLEVTIQRSRKFHSGAAIRVKEDGLL